MTSSFISQFGNMHACFVIELFQFTVERISHASNIAAESWWISCLKCLSDNAVTTLLLKAITYRPSTNVRRLYVWRYIRHALLLSSTFWWRVNICHVSMNVIRSLLHTTFFKNTWNTLVFVNFRVCINKYTHKKYFISCSTLQKNV